MKIKCNREFTWRHDGREEYVLGAEPVEMSEEAFAHIVKVFGPDLFEIVDSGEKVQNKKPKNKE